MSSATAAASRNKNSRGRQNVSNRGSYQNNFGRRETPEPETNNSPIHGIYADQRTAMVMCSFMGTRTTVKTRNGSTYKGHTTGFSDKGDIALCDAKLDDDDSITNPTLPGIIIQKDKFVVCKTNGVDLKGLCALSTDFTDSAIVNRTNGITSEGSLRELQPWQDDDAPDINPSLTLDDPTGGWEPTAMFAVNNEKFNVQSSYNEAMHEYTTKLPDPNSEGYEERQRFAQKHAEEIERSEAYQNRIAKELTDGDEEARYSAVHRPGDSQNSLPRPQESKYLIPARGGDGEQNMRNGASRNQGRTLHRQNSPYSASHQPPQQQHTNSRQMNNHYQASPPPSGGSLRNQGPPMHSRQQPPNLSYQQQPPPSLPASSQQTRPSGQHLVQQQHPGNKSQPLNQHQQSVAPPTMGSQHQLQQKVSPLHSQPQQNTANIKNVSSGLNGPAQTMTLSRQQNTSQINGGKDNHPNLDTNQRAVPLDLSSNPLAAQKVPETHLSASSSSSTSMVENQTIVQSSLAATTSPSTVPQTERRTISQEERKKNIHQDFHDFHNNFKLEPQDGRQEEVLDNSVSSTPVPTNVAAAPVSIAPEIIAPHSEATDSSTKVLDKIEEDETPVSKSKLNPNAKEFKPKSQPPAPTPVEAQSPSPQPRSSPIVPQQAPMYPIFMYLPNTQQKKRVTVSLGSPGVPELTAHQVTGQPLLATQHPQHIMYVTQPGQQLPPYQYFQPQMMPRMIAPNSIMAQGGQHAGIEQVSQGQSPAVFMTAQPQPVPTPMPAHLAPHPQPAHAQPLAHPNSNPLPQPTHVPNPAPSPVQHQHNSQQIPQPLTHHMTQVPPQSVTPQPAHYPQISLSFPHGISTMTMPRTSISGQQGMAPGHPSVSIGYPVMSQYPYTNGSPVQYPFAPAAQPQTSQNSSHGQGPQPQYVVMPQPTPQAHPPMQQHPAQSYQAGIQFQPQHNIMQGPPQMPPSHSQNPNQGGHHIIHSQMANLQQVGQPGMYMQVPTTLQQFQHQP